MTEYISKKLLNTLAELGPDYEIKEIDGENCIYRKVNSNYEIEIIGLNNSKTSFNCHVYLRDLRLSNTGLIVERLQAGSIGQVKRFLEQILRIARS